MMDITSTGFTAVLKASKTFPNGVQISQFADDTDPFDIPALTIAEAAMNINGDLVGWSAPQPVPVNIAVIPGSDDDINLGILFDANRAAKGKAIARDVIDVTVAYNDGGTATFSLGLMLTGAPARSLNSAGRYKSNVYGFTFQNIGRTRARQTL